MLINYTDIRDSDKWIDIKDLGVALHSKTLPESPNIEVIETDNINKRKIHLDTMYTHRDMEVQLMVSRGSREELRETLGTLTGIFKGKFSLIFKDNKDQLYKDILLTSSISAEVLTSTVYIITLVMTSYDPFRYNVNETSSTISNIDTKTITNILNKGNYTAKPIVKLSGSAELVNITTGGKTLSYVDLEEGEEIIVDNDKYNVIRRVNGVDRNALANWRDNFIELHSGENEVVITGENMNVNVTIEFRDTFL